MTSSRREEISNRGLQATFECSMKFKVMVLLEMASYIKYFGRVAVKTKLGS